MNEPILKENEVELVRVLSNPENFLISDDLMGRINLGVNSSVSKEAIDSNLESSFVVLLKINDTELSCPLLSYSKTSKYYDVLFLVSEEQVSYLFNLKDDLKFKLITGNATILKELTMTPSDEIEMLFGHEGYVKVRVRL